jgi:large subunit ribosomal protein L25
MSDIMVLSATARDRVGKGAARSARRAGLIPAVIYGDKKSPVTINLNDRAFTLPA